MRQAQPWQTWLVSLDPTRVNEQRGRRPCVVVSSGDHLMLPVAMAMVVPLTSRNHRLEHHVAVKSDSAGLDEVSFARTEDLRSLSTARFSGGPLGVVSPDEAAAISYWLAVFLARPV